MSKKIQVLIGQELHEVPYSEGESILDSVIRAGLNPPYSCMEGVCKACLAHVEEGEAEFPNDTILSKEEYAAGLILTCQARMAKNCELIKLRYESV